MFFSIKNKMNINNYFYFLLYFFLTAMPAWLAWLMPAVALLIVLNIINRVRAGLAEPRAHERG